MQLKRWMRGAALAAAGMLAIGAGAGIAHVEGQAIAMASMIPRSDAAKKVAGDGPIFVTRCFYSHTLPDDPIVHPDIPGASHQHDFFANDTTNASSTFDSMKAGGSTCKNQGDTAGYWVPSLFKDGNRVEPSFISAYYLPRNLAPESIQPFPAGLKMVAGDAMATGAQPLRQVFWNCMDDSAPPSSSAPLCASPGLKLHVRFPNCWDGLDLDSADHKSHMAYSVGAACPADHPVAVPGLQVNVVYPIQGGEGITLASGSQFSGHADFFNTWDQTELSRLVKECLNASVHCGAPVEGGPAETQ
jgi:hypothetical protein